MQSIYSGARYLSLWALIRFYFDDKKDDGDQLSCDLRIDVGRLRFIFIIFVIIFP
jgi:hypothetical protein